MPVPGAYHIKVKLESPETEVDEALTSVMTTMHTITPSKTESDVRLGPTFVTGPKYAVKTRKIGLLHELRYYLS